MYKKIFVILIHYTCINIILQTYKQLKFINIEALKLNNNSNNDGITKFILKSQANNLYEYYNKQNFSQKYNNYLKRDNDEDVSLKNFRNPIKKREASKKRVRRYLAFPEGASFTCAICATIGIIGNIDPSYMSFGLNWGLAYDLPNSTWILNKVHGFKKHRGHHQKPIVNNDHHYSIDYYHSNDDYYFNKATKAISKRETRRYFYKEIEFFIQKTMGYNGKDCILRALCESAQFFSKKAKKTMLEEIVKTIFSLPKTKLFSFEPSDFQPYDEAYRYGNKVDDCSLIYDGCHFSLLDLAFGKYSEPPSHLPPPAEFSSSYDPFTNPLEYD